MEHTPGPWKAKVASNPVPFRRQTRYGNTEIWPHDQRYGKVVLKVGGDTAQMKAANARLIAAAPELLAVARWALTMIAAAEIAEECADGLRAAIARAEGK